ncbi:uncharacterized protein F5147DRAFT_802637 [Suillus discolor]|uniref:Uncharacterized protein n=1 Tax=Suillus discolor TaxID=1912936 RepID=A0A9P7JTK7_9AGAM|nr:uncharacterized protein F5147DRAFT_802637 [Suillus discolor]KAG2107458.1 hypothetical protein F5147DRAFT_802637 [Suillus discolor]
MRPTVLSLTEHVSLTSKPPTALFVTVLRATTHFHWARTIFHDNNQDIEYLKSPTINADLPNPSFLHPDAKPDSGIFVLDTSDLFAALEGEGGHTRRLLEDNLSEKSLRSRSKLHGLQLVDQA